MAKRNLLPDPPFLILGTLECTNYPLIVSGEAFNKHKHILGVSGSGKSYLLAWIVLLLLKLKIAFTLIDPHGDTARLVLSHLIGAGFFKDPRSTERLLYVDFSRTDRAIPFNILNQPYPAHITAQKVLEAFQRAFPATITTTNIDNVILTGTMILISANLPFTDLPRLILDKPFRETLLTRTVGLDPLSVQFFKQKLEDKSFVGAAFIDSALKRSFLLTFAPAISNCLGMRENRLNFKAFIDQGTSVIYNLGELDEPSSKRFLGCLVMTGMEQAFLSRASLPPKARINHHLLVDESATFTSQSEVSFSNMLDTIRKYAGTLYLCNQTMSQINPRVTGSLQNAMSILLRLGTDDSGWAVSRFFLPPPEPKPESLGEIIRDMAVDLFGLEAAPVSLPNAFANAPTRDDARRLYETLERQAIMRVDNTPVLVRLPTLPDPRVTPAEVQAIEDTYADLLLEPVSSSPPDTKVVQFQDPNAPPRARRRSP